MALEFRKTHDEPGYYTEYEVREDGRPIGTIYREWDVMEEWGLDAGLEERFGQNAASGHQRVQGLMAELRQLAPGETGRQEKG